MDNVRIQSKIVYKTIERVVLILVIVDNVGIQLLKLLNYENSKPVLILVIVDNVGIQFIEDNKLKMNGKS